MKVKVGDTVRVKWTKRWIGPVLAVCDQTVTMRFPSGTVYEVPMGKVVKVK